MAHALLSRILLGAVVSVAATGANAALINLDYVEGRVHGHDFSPVAYDLRFNISFDTDRETVTSLTLRSDSLGLSAHMPSAEVPYTLELKGHPSIPLWDIDFVAPLVIQTSDGASAGTFNSLPYQFIKRGDLAWYETFHIDDIVYFGLFGDELDDEYWINHLQGRTITINEVPEPSTLALFTLALAGFAYKRRVS